MLYSASYKKDFPSRKDEIAYQRLLAERLLEQSLLREYGVCLASLRRERTPEGKPYFVDSPIHFSLSHCQGYVCCALSLSPVGVDGERIRPVRPRLIERVCTSLERDWILSQKDEAEAFLTLWTLKESVMKLTGKGIGYGFHRASFTFEQGEPRFREPEVQLSHFKFPGGISVAAASKEERFFQVQELSLE